MILAVTEDFDGFKMVYSVVNIDSEPPEVVKAFTTKQEAEDYIRNTPIGNTLV